MRWFGIALPFGVQGLRLIHIWQIELALAKKFVIAITQLPVQLVILEWVGRQFADRPSSRWPLRSRRFVPLSVLPLGVSAQPASCDSPTRRTTAGAGGIHPPRRGPRTLRFDRAKDCGGICSPDNTRTSRRRSNRILRRDPADIAGCARAACRIRSRSVANTPGVPNSEMMNILVGELLARVFEHRHQSLFRAVPGTVILVHHDEVGVVCGFLLRVRAIGDVVIGESNETRDRAE